MASPSAAESADEPRGISSKPGPLRACLQILRSTAAVEDLSLDVADGEFLVLLGLSGCGKTTSLRMLAGLERFTYGRIEIGGRTVNALPPKARDVAMVFQSYALFRIRPCGEIWRSG